MNFREESVKFVEYAYNLLDMHKQQDGLKFAALLHKPYILNITGKGQLSLCKFVDEESDPNNVEIILDTYDAEMSQLEYIGKLLTKYIECLLEESNNA